MNWRKWVDLLSVKLKGRAGQIAIAQSLSTLLLFVVDIFFARRFSIELFGSWKQILLISNFLIPLASIGLIDGFKYFAAKDHDHWKDHYSRVLISLSFLSVLVFVLFYLLKDFIFLDSLGNPLLLSIWWVFPIIYLAYSAATLSRFASINDNKEQHFLHGMLFSISVNLIFYGIAWTLSDVLTSIELLVLLAASLFTGHFVRHAYMAYRLRSWVKIDWKSSVDKLGGYFKYGIPLYLTSFLTIIILNTDKTVVSIFAGVSGFAIYSVGAKEVPFLSILSSSVYQSTFPELVKAYSTGYKERAVSLWLNATSKVSDITYPLVVVLMLFAQPIITFLYGEDYEGAVRVFQAYLFLIFWRNNYYGALLSASGKTVWIMGYGFISVLLNIGMSILFYNYLGAIGVVWGTIITVSFVNIAQMVHEGVLLSFIKLYLRKPLLLLWIVASIILFMTSQEIFD